MIKALSLTQPYATLIALGYKLIETRPRRTSYRGPLLIHASATRAPWAKDACNESLIASILERHGLTYETLPRGVILCRCELREVARMVVEPTPATKRAKKPRPAELVLSEVSPAERAVGFYAPGRFALMLADVQLLPEPVQAKGALSLWDATAALQVHEAEVAMRETTRIFPTETLGGERRPQLVQPTDEQQALLGQANELLSGLSRTITH
jgi:hypothetical protein